jgi:hypothetical protein
MNAFEKICYIYDRIRLVNDEPEEKSGLSHGEIVQMFTNIDLSPNPLLIKLYEWHNGIDNLNAFLHLLSLSHAIDIYDDYEAEKNEYQDYPWNTSCFPVLSINGDVHICVDINTGSLISIRRDIGRFEKIADRYENYLDALFEVFEGGLFVYEDVSGSIEIDDTAWQDMMRKYNIKNV